MSAEVPGSRQRTNPFNDFVFIDATPSDRGSFTLATEKALEKLEKFQLPDPSHFVLQWVQALIANQAPQININFENNTLLGDFELVLHFGGPGYERDEIDELYDHVFRSGRDRRMDRLRELALGWLSASALGVTFLALESNGRRRTKEFGRERTESCKPKTSHSLTVRGKGNYRFEEIVKHRCIECTTNIFWNGEQVNITAVGSVPWPGRAFSSGSTSGVMGATYGSPVSHIVFLRYGVEFASRPEPSLQPPVVLRVSDSALSKNVSQTDVVKDEAYEIFLRRLRTEAKAMGLKLPHMRIPSYQREALNRFLQAYLMSHIDVRVFNDPTRLELLGEEYASLIHFPVFSAAGRSYLSLENLRVEHTTRGYLLYSLDERAKLARWSGTLLILQPEEVPVLRKFFTNVTALSWEDVRVLSQGGITQKIADARRRPVACEIPLEFKSSQKKKGPEHKLQVPDIYPTGQTVVTADQKIYGKTIPGVDITLIVQLDRNNLLDTNELAHLKSHLPSMVKDLLMVMVQKLMVLPTALNQSRPRYAELISEQLLYLLSARSDLQDMRELLEELGPTVKLCPLIGLENGEYVSIADLLEYLNHLPVVYLGGVFFEGLESGALDPMPCAQKLVESVVLESSLRRTESLRREIQKDKQIRLELRRQTAMKNLAHNPRPEAALRNFANDGRAHAQELDHLEHEFRRVSEGKLFTQPDSTRLLSLSEQLERQESDTESHLPPPEQPGAVDDPTTEPKTVAVSQPTLSPIEFDLQHIRARLGDFCSTPGAIHVERRESLYAFHLSNRWMDTGLGEVVLLCEGRADETLVHTLPLDGFLRVSPDFEGDPQILFSEGIEQLVLKALQVYRDDSVASRTRKRLQNWLLECSSSLPDWLETSPTISRELLTRPLVPCLGNRLLSWKQLLAQAKLLEKTLVADPKDREARHDPLCAVLAFESAWRDTVLANLGFPTTKTWCPEERTLDFDLLLQSSVKEIVNVLNNNHADLLDPRVVGKLQHQSSFWTRWTSGFLSWDSEENMALVNPRHKLAKQLLKKFQPDPTWSVLFSCALFSTINRGLEEIEDRHEREFLMGLLDTVG